MRAWIQRCNLLDRQDLVYWKRCDVDRSQRATGSFGDMVSLAVIASIDSRILHFRLSITMRMVSHMRPIRFLIFLSVMKLIQRLASPSSLSYLCCAGSWG